MAVELPSVKTRRFACAEVVRARKLVTSSSGCSYTSHEKVSKPLWPSALAYLYLPATRSVKANLCGHKRHQRVLQSLSGRMACKLALIW